MHKLRYYEMNGELACLDVPEKSDFKTKEAYNKARDEAIFPWAEAHRQELIDMQRRVLKVRENLSGGRLKADAYTEDQIFRDGVTGVFCCTDADAENNVPFVSIFAEIELYLFQFACLEAPCLYPGEY